MRPSSGRLPSTLGMALVLVFIASACATASEPVATTSEPAATTSEPAATTSEPVSATSQPTTTTSSGEESIQSTASLDGDLHPGRYRTEEFTPVNFSFEIREPREDEFGWRGEMSREENQEIARSYGLDPEEFTGDTRWSIVAERAGLPYFEFIRLVDPERQATSWGITLLKEDMRKPVEEVVNDLLGTEGLEVVGDPIPAELGGAEGMKVEGVVTRSPEVRPFAGVFYAEGQKIRFYVLELEGVTKVVTVEAPVDEFKEFLPEAEEMLSTVRFLDN